ncbi:M28 family metallopeptidase [Solibacillus sp. CAU 1738]|uniref:M28 family metallopeptidase n=1 Tax=Solibacillus sp. CAU 1738 TaxID=3140363 RepID=UPI0032615C77
MEYGKDFLEQKSVQSIQLQLPICPQQETLIQEDCIFIANESFPVNNPFIKGVLKSTTTFSKRLPTHLEGIPIYQIQEEIYLRLLNNDEKIQLIEMNMELYSEKIEAYNVVGKISGTGHGDHKDAMIITAHFDSVGAMGDSYIEGALDNASGVASLIQLISTIQQHSLANEFQSDIIFVAFNGEESNMLGSEAFVKDIAKQFTNITNINIDCIGIPGRDEYTLVNHDNGQMLREQLVNALTEHQINIQNDNPPLTSDHKSFANNNFPAITISQRNLSVIHTLQDTKDNIDPEKLHEIMTVVFNFIIENDSHHLDVVNEQTDVSEEDEKARLIEFIELANEESRKLQFGQYKLLELTNDEIEYTHSMLAINSVAEFTSTTSIPDKLNWLRVPEQLNSYSFNSANMHLNITPDNNDSLEIDKVYEIDVVSLEDFNSISLTYLDSNFDGYSIWISTSPIQNNETNKLVTFGEHEYTVYDSHPYLTTIHTTRKWDNKTYYYSISKIKRNEKGENILLWNSEELEQELQTIDSFNLEQWTQQMGL